MAFMIFDDLYKFHTPSFSDTFPSYSRIGPTIVYGVLENLIQRRPWEIETGSLAM